ncbi:MAG: hypothetical protein AB9882_04845 [Ignavibacteriaceae bacterium]
MSDTEKLSQLYTEEVRTGQLNQDLSFSVSLCSNSALLKDLQSDIKDFNSESKFKFVLKDSKNILFQVDEDLLRLCFSSLLKWISSSLLPDDTVEIYSSNSDNSLLFRINMPESTAIELRNLMINPENIPFTNSDNFKYFKIFLNSFTFLKTYFNLNIVFNKSDNHLVFTLPVKYSPVDGHHSKKY